MSDTRTPATDAGGDTIADLLRRHGHDVAHRAVVPDEIPAIRQAVMEGVESGRFAVMVLTGGTGIAPRDVTPEALAPLLTREIPGFGELFRQLSYAEIGPAALLSRAVAGVVHHTLVFAVPGAPESGRLAVEKLIGPMLPHAAGLLESAREEGG